MKLLRIIPSMNPKVGGPPEGVRNITPHLLRNGIHTTIVALDDINANFEDKGLNIINLGRKISMWGFAPRLSKWLQDNLCEYDVVVCHGMWLYHSFATRLAILKLRKKRKNAPKLFLMPHGMLDPYFQKSEMRRLKSIRNFIYWFLIERINVEKSDGLLFTCAEEMCLAKNTFPLYKPRATYNIGYGINPPPKLTSRMSIEFKKLLPVGFNRKYFLFLSRVHQKKGIDILINSFAKTADSHDFNLIICGPYEEIYKNQLLDNININTRGRIHFCGNVRGEAKWGAIYGCDAFILPSHQENFGIAIVEALACGKAVLISNKVNIWREIDEGGAGCVGADTREGVDQLLLNWISKSPNEKEIMSKMAVRVYAENFFIEKTANSFINLIKNSTM